MKATKEQGQALLLVDVGLTTMTQQQWQNDDSKQNEDLCVLENAKGTVLTPNIQGGLVLMLTCHAVISYDGDSSLSPKLQNPREIWSWHCCVMLHALPLGAMLLREHQSDQALVNEGGCLTPICSPGGSVLMMEMVMFFPYTGNEVAAPWMQSMLELPRICGPWWSRSVNTSWKKPKRLG